MDNKPRSGKSAQDLVALYETLDEQARHSLCDFAEYLAATTAPLEKEIPPPAEIPRPEDETVVGAIKRLKATYHMVESISVFSKASSLMTQHMMNGRDATEVIDEMEVIFEQAYQELLDD
jgi:hypothetical protein